jgi:hypothetical protein
MVNFLSDSFNRLVFQGLQNRIPFEIIHADSTDFIDSKELVKPPDIDMSRLNNPLVLRKQDFITNNYESTEYWETISEQYSGTFITLAQRISLGKWDISITNFLYKYLLNFWRNQLINRKVQKIVFQATPHLPAEFTCMVAAKQLGISYIFPARTHHDIMMHFRESQAKIQLKSGASPWLERSRHQNSAITRKAAARSFPAVLVVKNIERRLRTCFNFLKMSIEIIRDNRWRFHFLSLTRRQSFIVIIKTIRLQIQIQKYMSRKAINLDQLPNKFCYFPLQYQPEKTTQPEARWFHDQISSIMFLRSILPSEMSIVVKEHPKLFFKNPRNPNFQMYRSINFYDILLKIPNTTLISPNQDSADVISKSAIIASATGSSIWEGLLEGIPGISFARNWHSDFVHSKFVLDLQDPKDYILKELSKSKDTIKEDLSHFISELSNETISTVDSSKILNALDESEEVNSRIVENYVQFLTNFLIEVKGQ